MIEYILETPVKIEVYMDDPDRPGKKRKLVIKRYKTINLHVGE
ncbi:MAG: hypothetical protein ABFS28_06890 [Bacteroidota bacterium]